MYDEINNGQKGVSSVQREVHIQTVIRVLDHVKRECSMLFTMQLHVAPLASFHSFSLGRDGGGSSSRLVTYEYGSPSSR